MRLHSMYSFYAVHFGYGAGAALRQRISYGRAIRRCGEVLREAYDAQSILPIVGYESTEYPLSLTVEFLQNALALAQARFANPIVELAYLDYQVEVNPNLVTMGRRRGLYVDCPILLYAPSHELIFLTFGPSPDMLAQLGVFRTLSEQCSVQGLPVPSIQRYTYWDLRGNTATTVRRDGVLVAPIDQVRLTCNRILGA